MFTLHSPGITVTHHLHKSPACDLYTSFLAEETVCAPRGPQFLLFCLGNNLIFVEKQGTDAF